MVKRSAAEWRGLFEAQARSGLTASRFCKEQGLCPKYFSLRKKALSRGAPVVAPSPFVRVESTPVALSEARSCAVRLRLGRCEWELRGLPVNDLVRLMQALA